MRLALPLLCPSAAAGAHGGGSQQGSTPSSSTRGRQGGYGRLGSSLVWQEEGLWACLTLGFLRISALLNSVEVLHLVSWLTEGLVCA